MSAPVVVMNMFYTGLGIARSLGERGVRVIGLSSERGVYGNLTRYAEIRLCPDSRSRPEEAFAFLMKLGAEMGPGVVLFPTRDDDVALLDRYRDELSKYFVLAVPSHAAVHACLDKWETYLWALQAGVPAPRTWMVRAPEDMARAAGEAAYPCVVKPLSSRDWHRSDNWSIVGGRKAFEVASREELLQEYAVIAAADPCMVVQEMIPGDDDQLFVAACYFDRDSRMLAGFTAQKLVQYPKQFGTGCIVQTVDRPELLEMAGRLLSAQQYTGIAEVEFKRDPAGQDRLIEVNARPWDQHRLGRAAGMDLIATAYCDYAGLPPPEAQQKQPAGQKWICEDVFLTVALRALGGRDRTFSELLRDARGKRVYALWSPDDPLPFFARMARACGEQLNFSVRRVLSWVNRRFFAKLSGRRMAHDYGLEKAKGKG